MNEAFYADAEFWVLVSFIGFVLLAFVPLRKALNNVLDARSAQIASELEQAKRLREEAEELLATYQKKQQEALRESEALLASTKKEAELIAKQSEADLARSLEKRKALALEKIAQAETKALQDVKAHVVDITVAVARTIITEELKRSGNDDVVKQAAAELERKLH